MPASIADIVNNINRLATTSLPNFLIGAMAEMLYYYHHAIYSWNTDGGIDGVFGVYEYASYANSLPTWNHSGK